MPLSKTSRKTCVSNVKGVESKGTAERLATSVSERATVCETSRGNELGGAETRILHAREDLVDVVLRLGDEAERGGVRRVRGDPRGTRVGANPGSSRHQRRRQTGSSPQQRMGNFLSNWAQKINGVIDTVVSG